MHTAVRWLHCQAGASGPSVTARCCALQVLEQDRAPALFNLVFAEGIINDATTVAVLRTVQARLLQETANQAAAVLCSSTRVSSSVLLIEKKECHLAAALQWGREQVCF